MATTLREPLIRLIDSRLNKGESSMVGTVRSSVYRWYDATLGAYLWVMDVDLGDTYDPVMAIPIADGAYGVHKLGPGAKVRIARGSGRRTYEVIGTAAIATGQVVVVEVTYSDTGIALGASQTFGSLYRPLTYTELGDSANNGGYAYGELPYGTLGRFDYSNTLISVLSP